MPAGIFRKGTASEAAEKQASCHSDAERRNPFCAETLCFRVCQRRRLYRCHDDVCTTVEEPAFQPAPARRGAGVELKNKMGFSPGVRQTVAWSHCGIKLFTQQRTGTIIVPGSVSNIPGCRNQRLEKVSQVL